AVSNYGGNNLPNAIANASGFASGMIGWPVTAAWTNSLVRDSDFVDPQLPNGPGGFDTFNFDARNVAISYFSGHGTCDAGFPGGCGGGAVIPCVQTSACSAAVNPWGSGAGVCRYWPGGSIMPGTGYCAFATPRFLKTNSAADTFGHWINYSNSNNNYVGWGESPSSGAWRGAGQNGNTNLVVLDLSNGVEPSFEWRNLSPAFAGVHMIATLMPTAGDTA